MKVKTAVRSVLFSGVGLMLGGFLMPSSVIGGNGTVVSGSPHQMNLSVAFLYDEQNIDDWKPLFEEASKLLYNATERQMQFGTITVYNNCPAQQDDADIHIENSNAGAQAHPGGLGNDGLHLWISQTHKSTSGGAIGQFGVVHELGHYAFNLYDEYLGNTLSSSVAPPNTPTENPAETFFCTASNGAGSGSIMDGGTTVSPNNTRTEFCTDPDDGFNTSHESGYINGSDYIVNRQQHKHGESSWETMVSYAQSAYGIALTAPTEEPKSDVSGHQPITWEIQSCDTRAVISVDRSGSMFDDKIALAKEAGKLFVDLANTGEDVGVTSFASTASINFALQEVTDDATKQAARNAIDGLVASGSTNIGEGLQTSLGQITGVAADQRTDNEIIVLLSDGQHNTGTAPGTVLPAIKSENVTVHTVGLGADADLALLQQIASETGGRFSFAGAAGDLPGIFTQISAESRGEALISQEEGQVMAGEEVQQSVFVDEFNKAVTFVLSWSAGQLQLSLETPGGIIINPAAASINDNIDFIDGSSYQIYKIRIPETGYWNAKITGDPAVGPTGFVLSALDKSDEVEFNIYTNKDQYVFPEKVAIRALVEAGQAVDGASVSGTVNRPDGTSASIDLFDDGQAVHVDEQAGDGIYSNVFDSYSGDGVYTFDLVVINVDGVAISRDVFEEDPSYVPQPIPPFTRQGEASVIVSNVPDYIVAHVEYGPETINLKSRGRYVTAYIELEDGFDPATIEVDTVRITALDGFAIGPIPALPKPTDLGDFDNDGVGDLMVKFSRADVQAVLAPGMRVITLEGLAGGQPFVSDRPVRVIRPGVIK